MIKLSKKQRKALRTNAKLPQPRKKREHRQRISDIINRGRHDYSLPRYYWIFKW